MFDQVAGVTYTIYGMKTRVLLTMLIIFIVVAGVCITCGTVFVVRNVDVVDVTVQTANALTEDEKNEVIENSNLLGKNILFNLNQDKIAKKVKTVNSKFKLHRVTAKFPNRIILEISRRVPVFYDSKNQYVYDAEMCIVDCGAVPDEEWVDISGANLTLVNDLTTGDMAVGQNQRSQAKIEQLKVVASYFDSLDGIELTYDDKAETVGAGYLCLNLTIKSGVTFKIKIKPNDNFKYALEYTDQIYQNVVHGATGVYTTLYNEESGKFVVEFGGEKYHD